MGERPPAPCSRWIGALAVAVALATALLPGGAAAADDAGGSVRTAGPVRFSGGADAVIEVGGDRRLFDTVELRLSPDGEAVLVNELSMDGYLLGVAEMPPRWHEQALRAQAVAARTYAWRSVERGTFRQRGLGYDICATVACQVFAGAGVVEDGAHGQRWRAAVEATSDEVLIGDDGRPILARYFSSSGGRTLPNELVFPDEGPRPYLAGTDDPDDEGSPLHRWEVSFTRDEFDDVLSRGQTLGSAVPVAEVERDGSIWDPYADIVVTGRDGTQAAVPAVDFREFVSRVAAERHPDRFPGPHPRGFGRLPTTLPASRFTVEVGQDAVVVRGRGWGHGVGMGQYGARGKALRGMEHAEILAAYYDGLAPTRSDEVPDRVRVGLDVTAPVTVRGEGPVRLTAGDDEVADPALGTWEVDAAGGELVVRPPAGWDRPLAVAPTRVASGGTGRDDHVVVEAEVIRPALLTLRVRRDGELVLQRSLGAVDAGAHTAVWRYRDEAGAPVPPDRYAVAIEGADAPGGEPSGEPVAVEVTEPPADDTSEPGRPGWSVDGGGGLLSRAAAVAAAAVIAGIAVAAWRRRRA